MKKLREKVVETAIKFEISPDTVVSMPTISFCGNREFEIEGHSGLIEYTDEVLRISCREYEIKISGKKIEVAYFSSEHIRANGIFKDVTFVYCNDN